MLGAELDATTDALMSDAIAHAAPIAEQGGVIVESGDHLWWIGALGGAPQDLGVEGALAGAVTIDHRTLLATSGGFFLFDGQLVRSPLELEGHVPSQVLAAGPDLWISTESSLFLWRDQRLTEVRPELPTANAKLAFDGSKVWAASEGLLYTVSAEGAELYRDGSDGANIDALAIDAYGTLWIAENGALISRSPEGTWRTIELVHGVKALAADYGLWIAAEDGVWREEDGVFHPTKAVAHGAVFASAHDARLLTGGAEGLFEVRLGRMPEVIGLKPDQVLLAAATIEIHLAQREALSSASVTLDDAALAFDPAHPSLTFDPSMMEDGAHVLKIVAAYSDGAADAVQEINFATFRSRPPTWSADIAPLFADHCAMCHAVGGVGRRLDARQNWIENIDRILAATRERRMPLPPNPSLSAEAIDRIDDWRAAGFGE